MPMEAYTIRVDTESINTYNNTASAYTDSILSAYYDLLDTVEAVHDDQLLTGEYFEAFYKEFHTWCDENFVPSFSQLINFRNCCMDLRDTAITMMLLRDELKIHL